MTDVVHIIPAIDLQGGRCVRLRQGRFDSTRVYHDDALVLARAYSDQGAAWIHIVDLDAAEGAGSNNLPLLQELAAATPAKLQIGGGLRESGQLEALFEHGAARLVIGSRAITHAATVRGWLRRFGPARIVLALDVRLVDGVPQVMTHGWQRDGGVSLWDALADYADAGLAHLLCTDIALDGMSGGPNVALYRECVARYPRIALQASGGVRSRADLAALQEAGVRYAISGRALLEGTLSLTDAAPC